MQIRQLAVIASFVVLLSSHALGQARVSEASGNSNSAPSGAANAAAGNDLVVSLYNQLEALQREVQTLRGLVEEQGNQLNRMQTEQRNRYLDLDQRLIELSAMPPAGGPAAGVTPTLPPTATPPALGDSAPAVTPPAGTAMPAAPATTPGVATDAASAGAVAGTATPSATAALPATTTPPVAAGANSSTLIGTASTSPQDEQELYRTALKLLVEDYKYEESIQMFQTYINTFPQGRLFTNSLYWQGEAYLLVSGFQQAEAVFTRLLTEFPQDPKSAGAMLKLGKAYEGMGNRAKARETWQQLPSRYPDSANEIRLARDYLQSL